MLRLGSYEPLLELASGGMATVYIARQVGAAGFERIVVVKRVHRHLLTHRDFYDMFRDEARVASMVRHPNVVPVIDVVEVNEGDSELFLVMDYVESCSLSTLRKAAFDAKQRLPVPVVVRVMLDALAGLSAAHTAVDMQGRPLDIVHRDVSPQNIIVGVDGSTRLIDFGVAKASHRLTETRSGSMKGKFAYMSPEQASGQAIDSRTDLFAAGVVLHECLTDKRLFRGENELDTVRRIMEQDVPAPSTVQPGIPASLDAVVLKALERPPERRFQTAVEMMEALEAAVTPASHREVAAYVERMCGARLAERRDAVRQMLAGTVQPLAIALPKELESRSIRDAPETSSTEGRIAIESNAREVPAKPKTPLVAAVVVASVAIGALVFVLATSKHDQPSQAAAPPATTTTTTASAVASVSPAVTTAAPVSTEIVVEIRADAPLEAVRVPGSKRIEIAGSIARVTLDPWTAPLKVEATFEGNKKGVATLDPGTTSIHVAPQGKTPKPPPLTTTVNPTPPKPDLQGNPYGAQ